VQYVFVELVVNLYVKLIYKGLSQKPTVTIAKMLSLEDEVVMICVLGSLCFAESAALSSHSIAPFTSCA
jgi:hypothetical protein